MIVFKHFWKTRYWRDYVFQGVLSDKGLKGVLKEK